MPPQAMVHGGINYAALSEMLRRVLEVSVDTGVVAAATPATLTDPTKDWGTNIWADFVCEITGGTGTGQIRKITANIANTLTVSPAWTVTPEAGSTYRIGWVGIGTMATPDVLPVKDVTHRLTAESIGAGATTNVDMGPITNRTGSIVILRATYHASATAGVRLRFLYSPDGTNFDSPEDADAEANYFEPTFSAGATRQRSVVIAYVAPYVRLAVTNLDGTYAATVDLWTVEVK